MATEEPRPQSIQERIAALNQSQIGRIPNGASPVSVSRPAPPRAKSINNPPHEMNGSVVDNRIIGNKPASLRQNRLLPAPTLSKIQSNPETNGSRPPPALPVRKKPSQPGPALPPRQPPVQLVRRPSTESVASSTSFSTSSTSGTLKTTASLESGKSRLRAPAWGETELPPLPVRETSGKQLPSRPKPIPSQSAEVLRSIPLPKSPVKPALPLRSPSNELRAPPLPVRQGDLAMNATNGGQVVRKLPPVPSSDAINKIRQSSFAGLSKYVEESKPLEVPSIDGHRPNQVASDVPPPVPLGSRPDLAALQATKPKHNANQDAFSSPSSSTVCMKCRDLSGPDNHAAQFPRQSLPTNDLAWLANQLTAPFPSPTDKARAIFTWLHHNIKYDVDAFFNNCVQPSTPAKTLASGLAVCEGYAGLFATLATYAGLEAIVVSGHGKGFSHSQLAPGSMIPPFNGNHAWNVVKIDGGKWKLIDSCWGAGAVQGKGMPYIQRFDPTNFTKSNDEFGLSHFPANKDHFYRDDGRPGMSWEEYIRSNHETPFGIEQPTIFNTANDEGIGNRSFLPAAKYISIHQAGPVRFQFSLVCEHWTLAGHSKKSAPYLFLLMVHGIDGREDDRIPFTYVPGSGPNGGGDVWYVDIADPRTLGAPGQKLGIANLTSFGSHKDARGLTLREYRDQVGKVGMGWSYIAEWQLVV